MTQSAVPDRHERSAIGFEHVLRVSFRQPIVVNDLCVSSARQDAPSDPQIAVAFERASDDRHDSPSTMIDRTDLDRLADLGANFQRQVQLRGGRRAAVYRLKHSRSRL
jgi:hypothetical protein